MHKIKSLLTLSTCIVLACGGPAGVTTDESISAARRVDDDPPDYPDPPPDPTPNPEPPVAATLALDHRTPTSVTLRWNDLSGGVQAEDGNDIERTEFGWPIWHAIASFGGGSDTGVRYHTDPNLTPDRPYCYRVKTYNHLGTRYSSTWCVWTPATAYHRVSRIQLEIHVADVEDAGTDDDMLVRLNSALGYEMPRGQRGYLDYGQNDFERNSTFTYDLDTRGVNQLSDINQLMIYKSGHDAVCIDSVALLVNGVRVFDRAFGNTASTCRWMSESSALWPNTLLLDFWELRAHPLWSAYAPPPLEQTRVMQQLDLERLVEGYIANFIYDSGLYWAGSPAAPWRSPKPTRTRSTSTWISLRT
jgi:hypothetical protein